MPLALGQNCCDGCICGWVRVLVLGCNDAPLSGATVNLVGSLETRTGITDAAGIAVVPYGSYGNYSINISKSGYIGFGANLGVLPCDKVEHDYTFAPYRLMEDSTRVWLPCYGYVDRSFAEALEFRWTDGHGSRDLAFDAFVEVPAGSGYYGARYVGTGTFAVSDAASNNPPTCSVGMGLATIEATYYLMMGCPAGANLRQVQWGECARSDGTRFPATGGGPFGAGCGITSLYSCYHAFGDPPITISIKYADFPVFVGTPYCLEHYARDMPAYGRNCSPPSAFREDAVIVEI